MKKWKKNKGADNEVLDGDGFYISYNPSTKAGRMGFNDIGNMLAGILGKNIDLKDGEETALRTKDGESLILSGDFREQYSVAFEKGYKACLAVYKKYKKEYRNDWSSDDK